MGGRLSLGLCVRSCASALFCCCRKDRDERTPLGFCDPKKSSTQVVPEKPDRRLSTSLIADNNLHIAVCTGDIPFVRLYFNMDTYEVNHRDKENRNALHFACFYGQLAMVKYLWSRGCEVNACDNDNTTPLMKAVQSWEEEIVCFLLAHNANPHIKDNNGNNALHHAVYTGNPATAAKLLEYGGNIEERTKDGFTPLLLALRENRLQMAKFLVKMKANVYVVDFLNRNTLMYAVRCDSPVIVNLLIQHGVDMNFRDSFGWTALRYAVQGHRNVKVILLEYENNSRRRCNLECESSENNFSKRPSDMLNAETASRIENKGISESCPQITVDKLSAEDQNAWAVKCPHVENMDEIQETVKTDEARMENREPHKPESDMEVISLEEETNYIENKHESKQIFLKYEEE